MLCTNTNCDFFSEISNGSSSTVLLVEFNRDLKATLNLTRAFGRGSLSIYLVD